MPKTTTVSSSLERMLPHNIQAEQGVLGSLLIDPEALSLVADVLAAEDFYRDAHRTIFAAMLALAERHQPADFLTLCDELERRGTLETVGGASAITALINLVPTSGNVVYYGRIVARTAVLRRLIHAAGQIAAIAYDDHDADEALNRAEQLICAISTRTHRLGTASSLTHLLSQYQEHLVEREAMRGQMIGIPSGFADLDRLTGGFRRCDLIVLAARPGFGKTSCALSIAHHAALHCQRRIGIFSLEMSAEQLVERLIAIESGINLQHLTTGTIEDAEWCRFVEALARLSEASMQVDGTSSLSPVQIRSRARQWMQQDGLDLLIVDYLQLLQPDDGTVAKNGTRVQVIDDLCRSLKLLAHELSIPILLLAQLSRAVENRQSKVPQLSDLRESGGIEANADLVLFIYRDEVYNADSERRGYADLLIAKHRNGPTGQVLLRFEPETTHFSDATLSGSPSMALPSVPIIATAGLINENESNAEDDANDEHDSDEEEDNTPCR
jgi:replicative DNA helicase